jgi:RNA polymerase sigma factor (sigma-70 family)
MSAASASREALIRDHLWIVAQFAARYHRKARGVDLTEAGLLGLCEAAKRYQPARGLKFATYAWNWVKGAILEEIRLTHIVPLSKRAALGKTKTAVAVFRFCSDDSLGRLPAPEAPERPDPGALREARRRIAALPTPEHRRVAFRALRGRSLEEIAVALELAPTRVARILAEAEALLEEAA